MSNNRSNIIATLQAARSDHQFKHILLQSVKHLQSSAERYRIFDDFPPLLPPNEIKCLINRLVTIIGNIKSVTIEEDGFQFDCLQDKLAIRKLEKDIARLGCLDLLNEYGVLRADVRTFFGWQRALTLKETQEIICAYVGAINQVILQQSNLNYNENSAKILRVIFVCINKYYGDWTSEVMAELSPVVRQGLLARTTFINTGTRANFLSGMTINTIFDDIHCLILPDELQTFASKLAVILHKVTALKQADPLLDGYVIMDLYHQMELESLEKEMIKLSCRSLLDNQACLKTEILHLLDWNQQVSSADVGKLIVDHAAAINHAIVSVIAVNSQTEQVILDKLNGYLNKSIPQLVGNALLEMAPPSAMPDYKSLALGISGVGTILITSLSVAGVLLFKHYTSSPHTGRPGAGYRNNRSPS